MKQILKIIVIFSWFSVIAVQADDVQAKKAALKIIASISDDIATLVLNHNHEKNPEVAKVASIKLITTLADTLATVITKIKERKEVRSFDIYSQEEYEKAIIILSEQFIKKLQN